MGHSAERTGSELLGFHIRQRPHPLVFILRLWLLFCWSSSFRPRASISRMGRPVFPSLRTQEGESPRHLPLSGQVESPAPGSGHHVAPGCVRVPSTRLHSDQSSDHTARPVVTDASVIGNSKCVSFPTVRYRFGKNSMSLESRWTLVWVLILTLTSPKRYLTYKLLPVHLCNVDNNIYFISG